MPTGAPDFTCHACPTCALAPPPPHLHCSMAALTDGFLGNSSLTVLRLARTRITDSGCYHLLQVSIACMCLCAVLSPQS